MSLMKYFQKENIRIASTKSNLTSVEEEEIAEELLTLEKGEVKDGPVKKGHGKSNYYFIFLYRVCQKTSINREFLKSTLGQAMYVILMKRACMSPQHPKFVYTGLRAFIQHRR